MMEIGTYVIVNSETILLSRYQQHFCQIVDSRAESRGLERVVAKLDWTSALRPTNPSIRERMRRAITTNGCPDMLTDPGDNERSNDQKRYLVSI
jgi:hypothetical protein